MKKLMLPGLLLLAAPLRAQQVPNTLLGIKAGPSYTTFVGDEAGGQRYKVGLHVGVLVNTKIGKWVSIQPEVLYAQKGSWLVDGKSETQNRFSYLDIPLLARLHWHGAYLEAGPQYSLLLSAKNKDGDVVQDVTSGFQTSNFGYVAGLGYQLPIGLGLGLRYGGDLRSTVRPYPGTNGRTVRLDLRNSGFQASVFYLLSGRY